MARRLLKVTKDGYTATAFGRFNIVVEKDGQVVAKIGFTKVKSPKDLEDAINRVAEGCT